MNIVRLAVMVLRALAFVLAVSCMALGCDGAGGRVLDPPPCGGQQIISFLDSGNAEPLEGLTFTFRDGTVFHAALAGDQVRLTFDAVTGTILAVTLATDFYMASGEVILQGCNPFAEPSCLFDVTVTGSNFPAGRGPQVGEVLELQDWRIFARLDDCTRRVTLTLTVENTMGTSVSSGPLDLAGTRLCPLICAGP